MNAYDCSVIFLNLPNSDSSTMKLLLTLILILLTSSANAQDCACGCDTLELDLFCDTVEFDNGARIYWNFNCDSSWILFKNQDTSLVLSSMEKEIMELTGRLGYGDFIEYNSVFLGVFETISGCCTPPDYYVHDKSNGRLKKYLGSAIFVSDDKKFPYVVSFAFKNNSQAQNNWERDLKTLSVYNLETGQSFNLSLPQINVEKVMDDCSMLNPEDLFIEEQVEGTKIFLKCFVKQHAKSEKNLFKWVVVDVSGVGSVEVVKSK